MSGKHIAKYRAARGFTQRELAKAMGVTQTSIAMWETDRNVPSGKNLVRLADVLGVSVENLTGETSAPVTRQPIHSKRRATMPMRVLGRVHAGHMDEQEGFNDVVYEVPSVVHDEYPDGFLLRVHGDCMNREFPDGSHIVVIPCTELHNGQIGVLEDHKGDTIVRYFYQGANSIILSPASFNQEHKDIIIDLNDEDMYLKVIGRVVWYQASEMF